MQRGVAILRAVQARCHLRQHILALATLCVAVRLQDMSLGWQAAAAMHASLTCLLLDARAVHRHLPGLQAGQTCVRDARRHASAGASTDAFLRMLLHVELALLWAVLVPHLICGMDICACSQQLTQLMAAASRCLHQLRSLALPLLELLQCCRQVL